MADLFSVLRIAYTLALGAALAAPVRIQAPPRALASNARSASS
ncbi:Uncharacterised protein [Bordetella pertussis]|nr:Uncharacterised protein [Bordetella pertussis]